MAAAANDALSWRKRLIGNASVEVTVRDTDAATILRDRLPAGTRVQVTYLAGDDYADTVAQAASLARAGFAPVAHVAARSLGGRSDLSDYLARLAGEAGARRVLLVAGDLERPRGEFSCSLEVLNTGLLQTYGFRGVSFAAHPEGHPRVANDVMAQALADKLGYAHAHELEAEIVTQFCFEAAPILSCIAAVRALGFATPVRIGAAAPTNAARLLTFALKCGVGPSLRGLQSQALKMGRLAGVSGPEALIDDLAKGLAETDHGAVAGMHFFVFGSVAKAATWLDALRGRPE